MFINITNSAILSNLNQSFNILEYLSSATMLKLQLFLTRENNGEEKQSELFDSSIIPTLHLGGGYVIIIAKELWIIYKGI